MGCTVEIILAAPITPNEEFPEDLANAMEAADITVFFSRLGDQLRFSPMPGSGK